MVKITFEIPKPEVKIKIRKTSKNSGTIEASMTSPGELLGNINNPNNYKIRKK